MALGYAEAPGWIKYGNVYSNAYRRCKSKGMPMEEMRANAQLHSKVFKQHGLVHPELLNSFGPRKRLFNADA